MRTLYYRGHLDGTYSVAEACRSLLRGVISLGVDCALYSDEKHVGNSSFIDEALRRALLDRPFTDDRQARVALTGVGFGQWRPFLKGKFKTAIVNFESQRRLPIDQAIALTHPDLLLPSSHYSDSALEKNGVPAERRAILAHAIDHERYFPSFDAPRSEARFVVTVISSNHARKNLAACVEVFRDALADRAGVELRLRVPRLRARPAHFEIDLGALLGRNDPRILWRADPEASLATLLAESHVVFSMSSGEGFGLPLLEGLAAGCVIVCPRYSGQLDFLNDSNALLIDTIERRTPVEAQYVPPTLADPDAVDGQPSREHATELLLRAYSDWSALRRQFRSASLAAIEAHTPERIARRFVDILAARGVETARM